MAAAGFFNHERAPRGEGWRLGLLGRGPAHQRPVIHAGHVWSLGRGGREGASLAGREPHPLHRPLTERLRGLAHLRTRLAGLLALGLARFLGLRLGLARVFLPAPVAAVHSRTSRHYLPLRLSASSPIRSPPARRS